MHQDIWRTVERIVLGSENLEAQFDRLTTVLLPDHADVLVLLSLLADEAVLPPELLTSSLRRAYHGAIQMLLAIEAYCHGTRSRSSNTRSLLKTIGSMGQTLSESEFCDRLADLLGNERPLWNYIRQWLPLPYDEKVAPADFEFIDLCKRSDSELLEDKGAECIDDLSAVLGTPPPRKGGPLQVTGGQLNSLQNGVYVPIMISKEKSADEVPAAAQTENHEPSWTRETDMMILKTYNDVEGGVEDVVRELRKKIPYSPSDIEKRLNFLISLF
nr:CRE-GON-4 protein [Haemonchus contortus]